MLGWMILFALMIVPGVAATVAGYSQAAPLQTTSIVFALLFLASLITRALRSGTR